MTVFIYCTFFIANWKERKDEVDLVDIFYNRRKFLGSQKYKSWNNTEKFV